MRRYPFETVFCDILRLYFVYIDNKKLLLNQMSVGSASEIFLTRKNAEGALPATCPKACSVLTVIKLVIR